MAGVPELYSLEVVNVLLAPLDAQDARQAYRDAAEQRIEARKDLEDAIAEAADAEKTYRKELAKAFVAVDGDTAAQKEANARAHVAGFSRARDVKKGLVKGCEERLEEIDAMRQSLNRLVEWSMKVDPMAMEDRTPRQAA